MTSLRICHVYPDVLNLYGDRGNVLCMKRRLGWRNIGCEITPLRLGEHMSLADFDLLFIGGGQDFEQKLLLGEIREDKGRELRAAIEDGVCVLAICGGYQLLGGYYETHRGERMDFLGALDLYTVGGAERLIGNFAFDTPWGSVVGFENHSGRTYLGSGVTPLGKVIAGHGNNGRDGTEGARYKNVFGTYSHGPVLPKNPALCDAILETALERKYGSAELVPLGDMSETSAHDAALKSVRGEK